MRSVPLLHPTKPDAVLVATESKNVRPALHAALTKAMVTSSLSAGFAGFTPLPERLTTRLKYCEDFGLSGSVNPAVQLFAATSAYSPNQTASGHQPRGFDQIMAFYEWFVVDKCRIKISIMAYSTAANGVIGLCLTAYNTLKTVLSDYTEMPVVTAHFLPAITYDRETHILVLEYDAKKFMGVVDPSDADRLLGTVGASPSDNAFFHIFSSNMDESTSFSANCVAQLEYEVTFTQPVQPAES
jgi:hypothetical protein